MIFTQYPYSGHRCTEHDHSREIEAAEQASVQASNIVEAFWTCVLLRDWVTARAWVNGFLEALR